MKILSMQRVLGRIRLIVLVGLLAITSSEAIISFSSTTFLIPSNNYSNPIKLGHTWLEKGVCSSKTINKC